MTSEYRFQVNQSYKSLLFIKRKKKSGFVAKMLKLLGDPERVVFSPAHQPALPYGRYYSYSRYYTTAGTALAAL